MSLEQADSTKSYDGHIATGAYDESTSSSVSSCHRPEVNTYIRILRGIRPVLSMTSFVPESAHFLNCKAL